MTSVNRFPSLICLLHFVVAGVVPFVASRCPRPCFCNPASRIVYCARRGLPAVPEVIPDATRELNLNGNAFRSSVLERRNFSRYDGRRLEHLYLSSCGLTDVEVDSFADLVSLRWLDLSDNRLGVVRKGALQGLRLEHLFLNGNRGIKLERDAFDGVAIGGLYLYDCALSGIEPETLDPLAGHLRKLWINSNALQRLDSRLMRTFSALAELRLALNPLRCDCDLAWLKELYDKNPGEVFRGSEVPQCATPSELSARVFGDLSLVDFRCPGTPYSHQLHLHPLQGDTSTHKEWLRCAAADDSTTTLSSTSPRENLSSSTTTTKWPSSSSSSSSPYLKSQFHAQEQKSSARLLILFSTGEDNRPSYSDSFDSDSFYDVSGVYACALRNWKNSTKMVRLSWSLLPEDDLTSDLGRIWGHPVVVSPSADEETLNKYVPHQSRINFRYDEVKGHNGTAAVVSTATPADAAVFSASHVAGVVVATNAVTFAAALTFLSAWSRYRRHRARLRRRQSGLSLATSSSLKR